MMDEQKRTDEEKREEFSSLIAAKLANDQARDSFVAVAHTALIAASIAFLGDVALSAGQLSRYFLYLSWTVSTVGLIGLAISFQFSDREIQRRIDEIHSENPTETVWTARLNLLSLWSFPAASFLTIIFAVTSLNTMSDENKPSPTPIQKPMPRDHPDFGTFGANPPPRYQPNPTTPSPSPGTGVPPPVRMPAPSPAPAPAPTPSPSSDSK